MKSCKAKALNWADGISSALGSELANRIEQEEIDLMTAILNDDGEQVEILYLEFGKAGANGNRKHPLRGAWEAARNFLN